MNRKAAKSWSVYLLINIWRELLNEIRVEYIHTPHDKHTNFRKSIFLFIRSVYAALLLQYFSKFQTVT